MGKKTKVLLAVLLASVLGLVVAWFSSPPLRARGYQMVLNFGPSSLREWSLDKLKGLRGSGAEVLGLFVLDTEKRDWSRIFVLDHLGGLKEEAEPAIPSLIQALKDRRQYIRCRAADALGMIGPLASAAIPVLIDALKDQDFQVRSYAAGALGKIGLGAESVIPALAEVLKDENEQVRQYARTALARLREGP